MNLITQLVPGLRDTRAPVSAGVLWIFAAFLTWTVLPREIIDHYPASGRCR